MVVGSTITHINLAVLINRNAQRSLRMRHRNLLESDIELLKSVSQHLMMELHYEIHMTILQTHHIFRFISGPHADALRGVCHEWVHLRHAVIGEVIFKVGKRDADPHTVFVSDGTLEYEREGIQLERVKASQCIDEVSLWAANWKHRGSLRTESESVILTLSVQGFHQSMVGLDGLATVLQYAKSFVSLLNEKEREDYMKYHGPIITRSLP